MATVTLSQEVSKRAGWSIFMGILTAAVGVVMIVYPLATAAASTVFVGSALIIAGVAQSIFAFVSGSAGKFFLNILLGVLYGIAGIALVTSPGIGLVTLTAVLGVMLIAEAISETFIAFALPAGAGRGGFLVNAAFSLLLGVMILAQWPVSSVWAIGTMVGVAVLVNGITRAVVSGQIRKDVRALGAAAA
ncbi:MAG TPA: DUF308 domain-containing protein [Thermoanaerobaculia bacterium]